MALVLSGTRLAPRQRVLRDRITSLRDRFNPSTGNARLPDAIICHRLLITAEK
jgi:hypothetical protein